MVSSIQPIDRTGAVWEGIGHIARAPLQTPAEGLRSQASVFEEIFLVFLILGTLVGVVVIAYSLYNAIKYRDDGTDPEEGETPEIGELPGGGGNDKKLFLSFAISAVIIVVLIAWTYGALLYVEAGPADEVDENLDVEVEAIQFGWEFHYENDHMEMNTLYVPEDHVVTLEVTARDVWHTFGAPDLRVKADAIPGQTSETWFIAEETGTYDVWCFELCGVGHSDMTAEVVVLEQEEFDEWYEEVGEDAENDDDESESNDDDDAAEQSIAQP